MSKSYQNRKSLQKENQKIEKIADNWKNTLTKTQNQLGQEIATNKVLRTEKVQSILEFRSADSLVQKLQDEISEIKNLKPGNSVTYIETITSIPKVETILKTDTLFIEDSTRLVQSFNENDYWYYLSGKIYDDKIHRDSLSFRSELFVKITQTKKWFKNDEPIVEVKNLNPYTSTDNLISYQLDIPKPPRFSLGASTGVTLINGKITPYLGVGLNYAIIHIK